MQEKKYPIRQWAIEDRPREKLLSKSPSALSESELLAILLKSGASKKSAVDLARELLELAGNNLQRLAKLPLPELMRIKGIGMTKAVTIQASLELGRRQQAAKPARITVSDSRQAAEYLQAQISHYTFEVFGVIFLNQANYMIEFSHISIGGITGTIVDTRVLLRKALSIDAVKLILCHNHPSGNYQPSNADKDLTRKIREAATLLDIQIIDHLIVSDQGYFSFADEGLL